MTMRDELKEARVIIVKPDKAEEFLSITSDNTAMKKALAWKRKHGHQIKRIYGRNHNRRVKYD